MVEDITETVAGLLLEDKGAYTGSRETTTGVRQDRGETAGRGRTEDTDTGIEDEGEGRTEERTEICAGTTTGVSQGREETAVRLLRNAFWLVNYPHAPNEDSIPWWDSTNLSMGCPA